MNDFIFVLYYLKECNGANMNKRYYFIAVGGVGMSGLAKYLLQEGCIVSGSDISESKYTKQLVELGGKIFIGHDASNVPDNAVVVVSSAIKDSNVELMRAKELGLTIYHRSDLLAELSSRKKCFIGFAGTHGKTTTSGMASYLLSKSSLSPSYVVGGIIPDINTNANYTDSDVFVAELDESDGTVVKYSPQILVVNNLEPDHLDFYTDGMTSLLKTFETLISKLSNTAKILVNNDNDGVMQLSQRSNFITYGLNNADYLAKNIDYCHGYTTFDIYYHREKLCSTKIILPGVHNVYNALAVVSALHQAGYDVKSIVNHFEEFTGMGRRFQKVTEFGSIEVFDDYAHHPTEIMSTLSAMKSFTDKKVVAVFQPHRYTRLQSLWEDFKNSLKTADRIIITDVYAASEESIEGINSEKFSNELTGSEYFSGSIREVAKQLLPTLDENTVVIGLGAGSITNLAKELISLREDVILK